MPEREGVLKLLTKNQRRATARWLYLYKLGYSEDAESAEIKKLLASPWGKYLAE